MMNSPMPHPHLDLDEQLYANEVHRGRAHSDWVQNHANAATMDHGNSRVKALLLVQEAARLELIHLAHQREHAQYMLTRCGEGKDNNINNINKDTNNNKSATSSCYASPQATAGGGAAACGGGGGRSPLSPYNSTNGNNNVNGGGSGNALDDTPSPSRNNRIRAANDCSSFAGNSDSNKKHRRSASAPPPPGPVACGCLHTAAWRLYTPRCRVMALLKKHGETENLEHIVDQLRQTYNSDSEMMEDMEGRYGPEPTDAADPELLLKSVEERTATHAERWGAIRDNVDFEMRSSPQAFQNVIRTLSVMRIFIEGSQGAVFAIDFSDRQRREAAQHAVLAKLRANRALFVDQCA